MTSAVSLFSFKNHQIRVVVIDGKPWFVAAEVCKALAYSVKTDGTVNTTHALGPLDRNEITTHRMSDGRGAASKLIAESGLYKIIMRSDKPQAKPFQDWVTRTVLPAIRKDGMYVMGEEKVVTGEMSLRSMVMDIRGRLYKDGLRR